MTDWELNAAFVYPSEEMREKDRGLVWRRLRISEHSLLAVGCRRSIEPHQQDQSCRFVLPMMNAWLQTYWSPAAEKRGCLFRYWSFLNADEKEKKAGDAKARVAVR